MSKFAHGRHGLRCVALATLVLLVAFTAFAQSRGGRGRGARPGGGIAGAGIPALSTIRVASGLTRPIFATYAPGDFTRLFIIEKAGYIRVLKLDTTPPTLIVTPFLNIDSIVGGGQSTNSEQGLLGLAFHPNYATNGLFYVNYTNNSGDTIVARYTVSADPDVATPNVPEEVILFIDQPFTNHNGGWLGFGPNDNLLYVATGDGGSGCDPNENAQDITTNLLGKILRIDVNSDDFPGDANRDYHIPPNNPFVGISGDDEIWSYGLRNPWRPSFDRSTGDLYIADVGQGEWEEINVQLAATTTAVNYGWDCMEGNHCSNDPPQDCAPNMTGDDEGCVCNVAGLTMPVYEYPHGGSPSQCSVTGGYVYRGAAIPELHGTYFFADYNCDIGISPIWSFRYTGGSVTNFQTRTTELAPTGFDISQLTSFGEDLAGEMYICDQGDGEVFRIIARPPTNDACANGQAVTTGSTSFTSTGATTDGPTEPAGCGQLLNDVWFNYTASCNGTAQVNTCGSSFDTKLAVYGACPGAPGAALACNDTACGDDALITFQVTANSIYRIRVGSSSGAVGPGLLNINCIPCPGDINHDSITDVNDLLLLLGGWGPCVGCVVDLNGDDVVDVNDLLILVGDWGPC